VIAATRVAVAAALLYFLVGNLLGLLLGTGVISYTWRPAHAHINLLGFVAMMIYGVAYHALPRFRGVPLRRSGLALAQVIVANVALVGMALSWGLVWPTWLFAVWGTLQLLASVLFVALLVEVLWGRTPPSSGTPLPVR
jgi:hypothetical protein